MDPPVFPRETVASSSSLESRPFLLEPIELVAVVARQLVVEDAVVQPEVPKDHPGHDGSRLRRYLSPGDKRLVDRPAESSSLIWATDSPDESPAAYYLRGTCAPVPSCDGEQAHAPPGFTRTPMSEAIEAQPAGSRTFPVDATTLAAARKAWALGLCPECLGRLFGRAGHGLSNPERASRLAAALELPLPSPPAGGLLPLPRTLRPLGRLDREGP